MTPGPTVVGWVRGGEAGPRRRVRAARRSRVRCPGVLHPREIKRVDWRPKPRARGRRCRPAAPPSAATLPAGAASAEGRGRAAAGGGGIGRARPVVRAVLSRSLRCPGAFRPAGAMGNCHTVGPNEALVVSGERAVREVGPGLGGLEGVGARRPCPRRWSRRGFGVGAGLRSERGPARPGNGAEGEGRGKGRGCRAENLPGRPPPPFSRLRCSAPSGLPLPLRVYSLLSPPFPLYSTVA